ncbi:type VI secretion system protein TssA [Variovorax sp. dw_308]|uniref:type VI secretion system protein TssA n=1 Tax=Variovorax sp. dw_308 TaxID=2721546 RepID=UPI001C444E85|nr:type VI secretion system protein TssA [Variovorax sp. dw_308]
MLTPELVEALQAPISEASPVGDDLEHDPAFTALDTASQGKPEQQFGDKVIPAVEPEWRLVSDQSQALLRRAKDVRLAMLLLRASTRQQGVVGFSLGLQLLTALLDTYWDGIHPVLDAEEDNDPTMRLNALAPLTQQSMVVRDLYEASVGVSRGVGPIKVRDIAIAHNLITPVGGGTGYSPAQVHGALAEIHVEHPETMPLLQGILAQVAALQALVTDRTGRADAMDLDPLRRVGVVLRTAATAVVGEGAETGPDGATGNTGEAGDGDAPASGARPAAARAGELGSRQDVLLTLDRVIRYLQQTEPGNPAPLLIERAKRLIGVSFFEIMADLAPNALDTIETVTGPRPSSE